MTSAEQSSASTIPSSRPQQVREHLSSLQDRICAELQAREPKGRFVEQSLSRGGSLSRPRVLEGEVLERATVSFTHSRSTALPPAATQRRPELAGHRFEAVSLSLIVHPRNPYAPTVHANWRFFEVDVAPDEPATWWFGGGFDLTPYYGFEEDCKHWHGVARAACQPYGEHLHPTFKQTCDRYFYLPHRQEARGIGGLFFDDYCEQSFSHSLAMVRSISNAFLPAYLPILDRRLGTAWGERERSFQLYRRGRYVEFNLLHDRGTRFGLEAGGRAESILASLPPLARWAYDWQPEDGSAEAALYQDFLPARDWLQDDLAAGAEKPVRRREEGEDAAMTER